MSKNIIIALVGCFLMNSCSDRAVSGGHAVVRDIDSIIDYIDGDYKKLNELDKKSKLDELLVYTNNIPEDTLRRKLYLKLVRPYGDIKHINISYYLNHKVLRLSEGINDSIGLGQSLLNLGFYHYRKGKYDSAYSYYYRAERVYSSLNNNNKSGAAELTMAVIQKNIKDYVGAEASSIRAIEKLNKAPGNSRSLASANNNLGVISRALGNYDSAIEYYRKAIEYRKKQLKNRILNAGSYNNIGLVYTDKREYQKAIDFFNKGLAYDSIKYKKPSTYARLVDNRTYARFLSGEKANYPSLFRESMRIREKEDDQLGLATNNWHIAMYYASSNIRDSANNYAQKALKLSKNTNYNKGVLDALHLLSNINQDDDPSMALKYTQEHIHLNDSLQKAERRFRDQFARIWYETDELEQENTKVTTQRKWLINSILALAVLTLLGYILIQRRMNKKKLDFRASQQQANEEIYSLMLAQQSKLEEGKQLEKQRVSEELHDSVLGRLFGIRLSLAGLNSKQGEEVVETRKKFIDELKGLGQEIRQISHDLNASNFTSDKLYEEVVEELIKTQCDRFALKYNFESDPKISWDIVPDNYKVHLYRIIQEGLQNINKHARAHNVVISFKKEEAHHVLSIKDDGVGIEKKKARKGIGLKNMQSRVSKIMGKLEINGAIGLGTEVVVKFEIGEAA